jgi:hypothetical protein
MDDDTDESEVPTVETDALDRPKVVVGTAGQGPTAEIAPPSVRAKLPAPPPPGGKIPTATLRLVFGGLALLVAAVAVYLWLRGN